MWKLLTKRIAVTIIIIGPKIMQENQRFSECHQVEGRTSQDGSVPLTGKDRCFRLLMKGNRPKPNGRVLDPGKGTSSEKI